MLLDDDDAAAVLPPPVLVDASAVVDPPPEELASVVALELDPRSFPLDMSSSDIPHASSIDAST